MCRTNYARRQSKSQISIRLLPQTLAILDRIIEARRQAAAEAGDCWRKKRITRSGLAREILEVAIIFGDGRGISGVHYARWQCKTHITIRLLPGTLAKLDTIVEVSRQAAERRGDWWHARRITRSSLAREMFEVEAAYYEKGAKRTAKPAAKPTKARPKRSSSAHPRRSARGRRIPPENQQVFRGLSHRGRRRGASQPGSRGSQNSQSGACSASGRR